MQSEFQRTLNRLFVQSGKSVTQVAKLSGIDRAYLMRLLSGEKTSPSVETLTRLFIGLAIDAEVVGNHPEFQHGLVALLHASAMSHAPLKLAEQKVAPRL